MVSFIPYVIPLIAIIEIFLIIKIGGIIGFWATVGIVLLTGITGVTLLRHQGFQLLNQVQQRMQNNQMPATELLEGVALLMGGLMLVTPGFLTDIVGFCLLLPPSRKLLIALVSRQLKRTIQVHSTQGFYSQSTTFNHAGPSSAGPDKPGYQAGRGGNDVFEGEFERLGEDENSHPEKK